MSQRSLAALILINCVLLAGLVVTALSPERASAQLGRQNTQYMMISGEADGPDVNVLYFIDQRSTRMIAALYDSRNDDWELASRGRVISQDLQRGADR